MQGNISSAIFSILSTTKITFLNNNSDIHAKKELLC